MKTYKIIILFSFLLTSIQFGQSNFKVGILGGTSLNMLNPRILNNWDNGWNIGGEAAYHFSTNIDLGLNMTYYHYPYNGKYVAFVLTAIAGLNYKVTGKSSSAEEVSFFAKFYKSYSLIEPFVFIRSGIYHLNVGEITISEWFNANSITHSTYYNSGISRTNFFFSVGLGFNVPINSFASISLEGGLSQVFDSNLTTIPLQVMLQFSL